MADTLRLLGFILLSAGLHVASAAIVVDIPQKQYKVARGDNATLPCAFTPPPPAGSTTEITWKATPDVPGSPMIDIIKFNSATGMKVYKNYKGRAGLTFDLTKGKADLQLVRVTSADNRTYECHVDVQEEEDGTLSDTANLIVLVAPSTPKCTIEGKTEYFQDITLTCKSEEGTPTPTYKWQSYDVLNNPRPNPLKATDVNGVLSLYNISKDTSGFYVCTSTNEIRSAKCNLTMAVMAPSMSMASTAGIIGAAAGALVLLLVIIICCCCCRRKKNKEEEYAMGTPEDGEFTDKDPEEQDEHVRSEQERPVKSADRRDVQDERSERSYDRRSDYDDRRDPNTSQRDDRDDRYNDRRDRYDDKRDRSDDRQERYDDRRERNGDRQDRYDDRRDRNDDRRDRYDDRYDDRRDRYDDRRDRHDDRYDSDRYSDRYDSRDRPPSVPPNKPRDPRN
ncbi:glycoprotein A33 (transmembrane), paralog a precursor [Danio rerio]|uniref:Glycoprotein A33 (transmembrane), paralog a n=2 Tax=Danio rerio TaxID=7955 RepID=A0A0R4IIH3_DANRE|nr:glycoprotein A33 (transmembrane), paralog a precursor [Danio rerio]|eukprot:NP_001108577.2 cell surface A33 antigen precursor [Danio rerio]